MPLPGAEELVPTLVEDLEDSGLDAGVIADVVDPGGVIGEIIGESSEPPAIP